MKILEWQNIGFFLMSCLLLILAIAVGFDDVLRRSYVLFQIPLSMVISTIVIGTHHRKKTSL